MALRAVPFPFRQRDHLTISRDVVTDGAAAGEGASRETKAMPQKMLSVTYTIQLQVPVECWIDMFCKENTDLFRDLYIGHWLRGVDFTKALGWLCWEGSKNDGTPGTEPNRKKAITAWHAGKKLPKGWHRLDKALAIKAFGQGVEMWGADWMDGDHNDAVGYDTVIQYALLGDEKHERNY
jgi:hypothetical protein